VPRRKIAGPRQVSLLVVFAIATAIPAFSSSASLGAHADPSTLVPADQTTGQPSQPATRERILRNLKRLQDRTQSLHMTWDSKLDLPKRQPKDQADLRVPRILRNELWMDGETRSRVEQSFKRGRGYQLTRFGKTTVACAWQFKSTQPRIANIWSADDPARFHGFDLGFEVADLATYSLRPAWIIFRPLVTDAPEPKPAAFRVIAEDEGHAHLVKLTKTNLQTRSVEEYWVDPARSDVPVLWQCPAFSIAIDYEQGPDHEWTPSRWTVKIVGGKTVWATAVNTVTGFATNEKYPADALHLTFPEGTRVFDKRSHQEFTVGKNGEPIHASSFASPESLRVYAALEQPVDFTVERQSLKDALDFVAARYQIQVRLEPGIDLTRDVETKSSGVTLRQLLQLLFEPQAQAVSFEIRNGVLVIAPFGRSEAAIGKAAPSGSDAKP
jgi:hypothetical protein